MDKCAILQQLYIFMSNWSDPVKKQHILRKKFKPLVTFAVAFVFAYTIYLQRPLNLLITLSPKL